MEQKWWKECVVYQIYPRSFCDSNGDGIGDLRGIISKLDYLQKLGVDVVWLSPVYKSPNDDNGYDISDYQDIMDEFGTISDWEEMLEGMHQRGIKLVMDLVVNHSSDEHPWFTASRQSKDNPYRDYYFWRPGKDGREPNNWASAFLGPAWEYDSTTDEYYLHLFTRKQPDLNWENPTVRKEVFHMMDWWLKKGVDGFRMDVINFISKVPGLPDAEPKDSRYVFPANESLNGPRLLEFLGEMKREVLSKYDIITVGETPNVTVDHAAAMTDSETGPLNMVFQFEHMGLDHEPGSPYGRFSMGKLKLTELKQLMTRWQKGLEGRGWNSNYLNNHDQARQVSRFGDDGTYRVPSAKMLGTFLHLLQGTPYIYQGEEIGMTNTAFETIEEYDDIEIHNFYREHVIEGECGHEEAMRMIRARGRDNARTPVQWSAEANAGFTSGTPWLKVNPNYTEINAEQALADPDSIFYYYQKLIRLRKEVPAVVYGSYDLILPDHEQIYAFTRTLDNQRLLVILNFSADTPTFELPGDIAYTSADLLIGNYPVDPGADLSSFELRPYEARVYEIQEGGES
jgi:oligo-1,6-glucosidase